MTTTEYEEFPEAVDEFLEDLLAKMRSGSYVSEDELFHRSQKGKDTVPWGWQEVVCLCEATMNPAWPDIVSGKHPNAVCLRCHKRARWSFMWCRHCDQYFDYRFWHHANRSNKTLTASMDMAQAFPEAEKAHAFVGWAHGKSLCWNCITSVDPAIEGDKPPMYTGAPREARSLTNLMSEEISFDF